MAILYPARLQGQQYEKLANLGLIRRDLGEVLELCSEIESSIADPKAALVVRALWATAIVTYWRCFKSRQLRLHSSEVFKGDKELLDQHRRIGVIRDRVIAHPNKLWEEGYVTVSVRYHNGETQVLDAPPSWGGRSVVHAADVDVPILRRLVPAAIARVDELSTHEIENLKDAISTLTKEEVSLSQLPKAAVFKKKI